MDTVSSSMKISEMVNPGKTTVDSTLNLGHNM